MIGLLTMKERKGLMIINNSASSTSFGRYAIELNMAMPVESSVFSFAMLDKDRQNSLPGRVFTGRYPLSFLNSRGRFPNTGGYVNNRFFNRIFRRPIAELEQMKENGYAAHYVSQEVPPFLNDSRDIVTVHDIVPLKDIYDTDIARRTYRRFIARNLGAYMKYENIVTVSFTEKKELESRGFGGNVEVIYPAVPPYFVPLVEKEAIRKELGLPLDKRLILSVSIPHRRKNLDVVQKTVGILGGDYRLVRVGPPVGDSITFGKVDGKRLNMIYNASDLLLFPSLEEGFGRPVAEAMSVGLPAVVSDIPVMHEVADDAALFTEPSADACSKAVKDAFEMRETLSARGLERSSMFSMPEFTRRVRDYHSKFISLR